MDLTALCTDLQSRMRIRQIPGLALRLANKGTTIYSIDLGVRDLRSGQALTPAHTFRIGSLTKPIVAQAVLQLVARKRLDLNDSIVCYTPELAAHGQFQSVTISHLLGHTSGMSRGDYTALRCSDEDTLAKIASSPLLFQPGEHFKYSNWGYFLLGLVITRISGNTAEAFLADQIFLPMGMHRSGFSHQAPGLDEYLATGYWKGWYFGCPDLAEPSRPSPAAQLPNLAAGMISTADDYLRWLTGLRQDEQLGAVRSEVAEQMLLRRRRLRADYHACFGWFEERMGELPFYYCTGSTAGFSGFAFIIPGLDLAGVALCNHGACTGELREMLSHVCRITTACCFSSLAEERALAFNVMAASRTSAVRLWREQGQAVACSRDGRTMHLHPYSRHAFFVRDGDRPAGMLRISGLGTGNAVVAIGREVLYEKLIRLRRPPAGMPSWEELAGVYRHAVLGRVEVIWRNGQLYLHYGAAYETLLRHVDQLRFRQEPGAFCFEQIEFHRDRQCRKVVSFVLAGMAFLREAQPRPDTVFEAVPTRESHEKIV